MRFITVTDLRNKSAEVWRQLVTERNLVLTSNGRPKAILTAVNEKDLEESLSAIRCAQALGAVRSIRAAARASGADRMTLDEINAEIAATRKERRR
jgi:prevent-host-death family protein